MKYLAKVKDKYQNAKYLATIGNKLEKLIRCMTRVSFGSKKFGPSKLLPFCAHILLATFFWTI